MRGDSWVEQRWARVFKGGEGSSRLCGGEKRGVSGAGFLPLGSAARQTEHALCGSLGEAHLPSRESALNPTPPEGGLRPRAMNGLPGRGRV